MVCSIYLLRLRMTSSAPIQRAALFLFLLFSSLIYAGQANLAWDASSSSTVAGYNVYYGTTSGSYSSKANIPNQTSYTITNLTEGQTYYFAVTARDASGNESARSNEVKFTVPASTTPPPTGGPPVPSFTANPVTGSAPLAVTFSGSATGSVTSYAWDFGDGTKISQQNPTHSYSSAGSYTVSLTATGAGGSNTTTQSNYITVTAPPAATTPPAQCPCSTWAASDAPKNPSDPDSSAVNVGMKFTSNQNGYITGVRFYKGTSNTGTHVGALWTSTGKRLATVTFRNETASGWQQANFRTPVRITANTVYVVSYLAPRGHYAGDNNYFSNNSVTQGPLTALRSGVSGGNGVYKYSSTITFPTDTWNASNYWVDVVFKP